MSMHKYHTQKAFTIVELAVVILIIGILSSVAIFGYGAWQKRTAENVLKSDLSQAASQLKNDLNWKNTYPETAEAANSGTGLPKSEGTTFQYTRIADNQYCLTATSSRQGVSPFHISSDDQTAREGVCEGHDGPPIPGVGDTWVVRNEPTSNDTYMGLAYGNGKFVIVKSGMYASGTGALVSTDGINWQSYPTPMNPSAVKMTYGGGKFIAISSNPGSRGIWSTDGESWTQFSMPSSKSWGGIVYGSGRFVATASDGYIATSTDGLTWTQSAAPELNRWRDPVYCNGKFVVVASSGTNRAMSSADGINWTLATIPGEQKSWYTLACGGGRFVAVTGNAATTSTDGLSWTEPVSMAPVGSGVGAITYGNGKFVIVPNCSGGYCAIATSVDGVSWTQVTPPAPATRDTQWFAVVYGNGRFVATSPNRTYIMTSP